jgi:hypothetical protein
MGTLYTRGEAYVPVSTDGGTVNSITATYSGDLATAYVQVHDSTPKATLTFTDVGVATQVVVIGDVTYTWIATLTGAAYEVLIGANQAASHLNLLRAITGGAGEGTLYGTGTVRNPHVRAWDGHADLASTLAYTASTKISVVGVDPTAVVVTTETGTNTDWDVATLPRLAASAVPRQSTPVGRFATVTTDPQVVDSGAIVVLSSAEGIWTAVTYDDLYNGTVAEDRLGISVDYSSDAQAITANALSTDGDRVVDFKFDGDLVDNLGGLPLVKSGGTSLFIPSPIPGRGLAFRASVEHAEMASNQLNLEITEDLTLHMYLRRVAATDSVFLTFGNGVSAAAANNHLYTVATVAATGALTFSQENAGGTNTADTAAPLVSSLEWTQITYTRATAGTSVKLYINGILVDTSGALTKPTGGTAGVLTVGGTEGSVDAPVDIASLTIFNAELTADQVLAHCNRERGI